jgi:hypothetical protein
VQSAASARLSTGASKVGEAALLHYCTAVGCQPRSVSSRRHLRVHHVHPSRLDQVLEPGSSAPWSSPESDPTQPITRGYTHPAKPWAVGIFVTERPPRTPTPQHTKYTSPWPPQCLVPGSMSHLLFLGPPSTHLTQVLGISHSSGPRKCSGLPV